MLRVLSAAAMILLLAQAAVGLTFSDKMHGNIAKGNKEYDEENHEAALGYYMKAQGFDSSQVVPYFNAGDALYRLGKYPEGAKEFLKSAASETDSVAAMSYFNLGNSMFKADDFKSAAEAYKRSLLMDPDDEDAKFNLELAMKMMEQQDQQQNQQDKNQQNQQNQQNQDQQQDQQDQQQQNQEEQNQQNQNRQNQNQQQQDQQQAKQQPGQPQQEISPEELKRILAAIEASDKNTQEEMLKKTSRRKTITGKDW